MKLINNRKAFVLLIISVIFFFYYKREIISNEDNSRHLTIWKTFGGNCYVIPGKYLSIFYPKKNYLKTYNKAVIYIAWNDQNKECPILITSTKITFDYFDDPGFRYFNDYNYFISTYVKKNDGQEDSNQLANQIDVCGYRVQRINIANTLIRLSTTND